ncbi:MAG: endolytic transglycosylase MltG [Bdellovibrionales bacterium]|nr:endolytic transglycosylase MltG [Bdellovibrionales bacterium]
MSKEKNYTVHKMTESTGGTKWILAGLFLGLLALGFWWVNQWVAPLSPGMTRPEDSKVFEVTRGQSPKEISQSLETQGIIKSASEFLWLGRATRQWGKIKAGEYQVSAGMTALEIFKVITSGISIQRALTVREGMNMYEIGDALEVWRPGSRKAFVARCKDKNFMKTLGFQEPFPVSLEGYLYPDTYFLSKTNSLDEVITKMFKRGQPEWTAKEDARAKELGLTKHQVMILASMVEKETGAPQERPMISSVFHNRLKKKMRLQSDPTTIYGIWERYTGNIHKSDLLHPTDFNTYTVAALPVGPISNPGKDAIQAALYPATSEFLYFVSHNDGTHEFTKTFADHSKAVKQFQMDPKARQGKSWRDLKKSTGT